jgi:hypothetical protein
MGADCKSVAKATKVRILDPPHGARTAPDRLKRWSGAVEPRWRQEASAAGSLDGPGGGFWWGRPMRQTDNLDIDRSDHHFIISGSPKITYLPRRLSDHWSTVDSAM